jgi:hypothetical protein
MFSKEELIKIRDSIDDLEIKNKIDFLVFPNIKLLDTLINEYQDKGLLRIDKTQTRSEYFIHCLGEKVDVLKEIPKLLSISEKHDKTNKYGGNTSIHIIKHDDLDDLWSVKNTDIIWDLYN